MRQKKIHITLLLLSGLIVACQALSPPDTLFEKSEHGSSLSHEKGNNCMSCHYREGSGASMYTLAGSIFGNWQGGFVEFYADFGEAPVMTLEIDQLGNFYTTESISFADGLHVAIRNEEGDQQFMEDRIYNGSCNTCHGTNVQARIELN